MIFERQNDTARAQNSQKISALPHANVLILKVKNDTARAQNLKKIRLRRANKLYVGFER